nr:hypothetical protein [Micromonospora sp. DSM 115978]
MGVRNEKTGNRRSSDLMTTLMSGLDDQERRETINTIRQRIHEDREAAFQARSEQQSDGS